MASFKLTQLIYYCAADIIPEGAPDVCDVSRLNYTYVGFVSLFLSRLCPNLMRCDIVKSKT